METKIVIETCTICGTEYILGKAGVVSGCDKCLNILRDSHGHAWFSNEETHVYVDDDSFTYNITREEAFEKSGGVVYVDCCITRTRNNKEIIVCPHCVLNSVGFFACSHPNIFESTSISCLVNTIPENCPLRDGPFLVEQR